MQFLSRIVALILISSTTSQEFVTITWRNLEEFTADGWYAYSEHDFGPGVSFDKPSSFRSDLAFLDDSSNDGVWTGTQSGNRFAFKLDSPNFCTGITQANLTMKAYLSKETNGFFWPCASNNMKTEFCNFDATSENNWLVLTFLVDVTTSGEQHYYFLSGSNQTLNPDEFLLIDEISLTHDGPCHTSTSTTPNPHSCNEPCEYQAIDCHNYYSCVDYDHKEYFNCPADQGLAFDPILKVCDFMQNVGGCYPPEKCTCEYRPYPDNCEEFYYCPDTCRIELCQLRKCPDGLVWNIDAKGDGSGHQQCTLPRNAKCYKN